MVLGIKRVLCLELPTAGLVIGYIGVFYGIWESFKILLKTFYIEAGDSVLNMRKWLSLGIYLLELLTSILIICGINKKLPNMLLPWLILKGILYAIVVPFTSYMLLVRIYGTITGTESQLSLNFILTVIEIGIGCYAYLIIYSLRNFIRNEIKKTHQTDSEEINSNSNIQYNKT